MFIRACDPAGDRTLDPQIKSLLLYQLSYGVSLFSFLWLPDQLLELYHPDSYRESYGVSLFSFLWLPHRPTTGALPSRSR
jgi:hypothetical protein